MCGIAGFTHNAQFLDESIIRRMTAALVHRGPDQQGVHLSRDAAIGAVRLQVIDLTAARSHFKPKTARLQSSTTEKSIIFRSCGGSSKLGAIASVPTATPRSRYVRFSNGTRRVSIASEECSRWPSGRKATGGWSWHGTGWASSRFICTAADGTLFLAPN